MEIIKFEKATFEKNKLTINDTIDIDEWKQLGQSLKQVEGSVQFWIGDWARYGDKRGFTGKYTDPKVYDELEEITGLSRRTIQEYKQVSDKTSTVRTVDLTFNHHKEVAKLTPEKQESFLNRASEEKLSVRDLRNEIKKPHVSNNSGENEWYTPEYLIASAKKVMGSIDLDAASSEIANKTVKAKTIYTKDDDGLIKDWFGNVWLNPPYAQPLISQFSEKVINEIDNYIQCCVLVNNATETNWLQSMIVKCQVICLLKSRVKFIDKNGNPSGAPLQGQVVLYFGKSNIVEFIYEFNKYGICLVRGVQ